MDPGDEGGVVYRYGVVAEDQVAGGSVVVDHPHWGEELPCQRTYAPELLHKRLLVDAPVIVLSDDKQHDTFLSRHIVEEPLLWGKTVGSRTRRWRSSSPASLRASLNCYFGVTGRDPTTSSAGQSTPYPSCSAGAVRGRSMPQVVAKTKSMASEASTRAASVHTFGPTTSTSAVRKSCCTPSLSTSLMGQLRGRGTMRMTPSSSSGVSFTTSQRRMSRDPRRRMLSGRRRPKCSSRPCKLT